MNLNDIQSALTDIRKTTDELEKSLKLAGLVGTLFKETGWEMITVGRAAIELYTSDQDISGCIDMCGKTGMPPPRVRSEVMASIGAIGGSRSFRIIDRWLDILGQVECLSKAPYQSVETAYGLVLLKPVEELLVERVFTSAYPKENDEAKTCAERLMAVCLRGDVAVAWSEATKLAESEEYGIGKEFEEFRNAVSKQLSDQPRMKNPKTALTWVEWMESRKNRRSTSDIARPGPIRRQTSSSDKRLRSTFNGERGPILR